MKHIIHTTLMALLLWACLPAPLAAQKRNTKGKKTVVAEILEKTTPGDMDPKAQYRPGLERAWASVP